MGCMVNDHRVGGMTAKVVVSGDDIPVPAAVARTTYLQAQEMLWDYGPSKVDQVSNVSFGQHHDAEVFMVASAGTIGSKYWKCIFRGYTDGSSPRWSTPQRRMASWAP